MGTPELRMSAAPFYEQHAQAFEPFAVGGQSAGTWLQVLPHIDPVYGGLSAVVPRLATQLSSQEGVGIQLAAFCSPDEARPEDQDEIDLSFWPLSRSAWAFNSSLRKQFSDLVASANGVHIHGCWESCTLIAASAARKAGVPYVLSAHGMLERWALANKRVKKSVYAALFEHRNLNGAVCLHALTHAEALDYRSFGYRGPIAIIPNGVEANDSADPSLFLDQYPEAKDKRLLLFLGRIHYKKGVDLLVNAWAQLADSYPDALLVIAGPDSEGTLAKVMETVTRLDIADRVLFTGMLDASMKWSALAAAGYFVLPSYSEGLSVAALEAMSMGVPLILSEQCNLPQIAKHGAGWQVQTNIQSLVGALQVALDLTGTKRRVFRAEARELARREFGWSNVTERMASLYRWVTGGPSPRNVDIVRGNA